MMHINEIDDQELRELLGLKNQNDDSIMAETSKTENLVCLIVAGLCLVGMTAIIIKERIKNKKNKKGDQKDVQENKTEETR